MPHFLIIGGGIGGLAAAASFHHRGLSASVYERAPQLREVGAALALWPNAMRVLQKLGVMDPLVQRAHVAPAGAMRTQAGTLLVRMAHMHTSVPTLFAHRAHVHDALLSALPPNSLFLNKRCIEIQHEQPPASRVRARFDDGATSPWADGLIGADGIHSQIRHLTLHDGPPIYQGYVAWRGVADFHSDDTIVGESWGRGQRFGFIPLGGARVGWWATANKTESQAAATCSQKPADWKNEVLQRFAHWHAPIPALLAATPESAFLCNEIRDRDPLDNPPTPWGAGRITLLGDAAHPTTPNLGQGACMAIEDAAVLAHAAASIPEVPTAFRVYEHTRRTRTAAIVRESRQLGRIGQWQNPLACALRNFLVRLAPEKRMRRQFRDLWFYDAWEAPLVMQG